MTAGLRNDGFSTFGASHRTATYPKVDAAWTFTNLRGGDAGTRMAEQRPSARRVRRNGSRAARLLDDQRALDDGRLRQRVRRRHRLEAERTGRPGDGAESRQLPI